MDVSVQPARIEDAVFPSGGPVPTAGLPQGGPLVAAATHLVALLDAYRLHMVLERGAQVATWEAHARTIVAYLAHATLASDHPFEAVFTVALLDAYVNGRGLADG